MNVVELNIQAFDGIVIEGGVVLIDCWAPWCQPCKEFTPVFEATAEKHSNHTFAKLDTQAQPELTSKLSVRHVPTLVLFRDGILLYRQPGYVPAEGLDEIVEKAAGLDMDVVRASLEDGGASSSSDDL